MSRHLHVDPFCGAAGDMLLGALLDTGLGLDLDLLRTGLAGCEFGEWRVETEGVQRGALAATRFVVHAAPAEWRNLPAIHALLDAGALPPAVLANARAVFDGLAAAEAEVHGMPLEEVHFHEVGAVDSIIDIVGFCLGLDALEIQSVTCGPWRVGRGVTESAHGSIPLPPPATVALARGQVMEETGIPRELMTPTGAALLATLAKPSPVAPPMRILGSGLGAGTRDLTERPNVCRVILGEVDDAEKPHDGDRRTCLLLEANIDDQSPEEVAYALECVREAGARDAWAVPAQFKKGRAGVVVSVLVDEAKRDAVEAAILRETTSIGIRMTEVSRSCLQREIITVSTSHGSIRVKVAFAATGGVVNVAPEFEDAREAARVSGAPLKEVMAEARAVAQSAVGSR